MEVSVIIVNWNTKNLLRDCIQSILEHAGNVDYEIIVVDNASSDGSAEMVRSDFPKVRLIVKHTNRGYAAGVNDGIRSAKCRYVLLLNSDTLICDSAIEKTVKYADEHINAAVVGCQVWEDEDKIQMTCFRFPDLLNLFFRISGLAKVFRNNHFFGREDMFWWRRDSEREVDVVSGMFMLVRREAIDKVGLMDEAFFLYYEETDWCYRFSKAGWKMLFWPGAKIIHREGGGHSGRTNRSQLKVQTQKSCLIFYKKHYGLLCYLFARVLLIYYSGLRWLIYASKLLWKRICGYDILSEQAEVQKRWLVFKYYVTGREVL